MSSSNLIRLAGLAALGSGVLAVVVALLRLVVDIEDPALATTTSHVIVFLLYLCSTTLLLLGLVGLYTSQSETAGILGLAGFLVALVGTVLGAGALWFELFITPALAALAPGLLEAELGIPGFVLVALLGAVGWVLFGVATLRAAVYPRWAALLLMIGGVLAYFFPLPLAGIIFSVTVAYLGFMLFTGQVRPDQQPSRAT
jgi:hypothetical protein